MALDRDDADEIRRVTAMRFTAALLSAGRHTATDAVTAGLFAADELLSRLRPVAPASGAPATEPRRTVGAVVRDVQRREFIVVRPGDERYVQRRLDSGAGSDVNIYAADHDEFVRWATREECERHGLTYVARPLPGAPLAAPSRPEWVRITSLNAGGTGFLTVGKVYRVTGFGHRGCPQVNNDQGDGMWCLSSRGLSPDPESPTFASWEPCAAPSPAATPAAWVPSVGDVVTWGLCLWLYRVEAVTATSAYVRCCDKRGDIGDCTEVLLETPDLRRATSSERAAAGLPVDAPAFDEAKEREAAFASLGHNVAGTRDYVDGFVMGWLARARVAVKEPRSGDDRPASGQSATKPVDRDGLSAAMRAAFSAWRRTREDTRDSEVVATDAAIAFMAKGGAS